MPRDMRLTFTKDEVRRAVETMIAWGPERIILAHGDGISGTAGGNRSAPSAGCSPKPLGPYAFAACNPLAMVPLRRLSTRGA
jgi:hypothetical protein